jgi:hypothetical protein
VDQRGGHVRVGGVVEVLQPLGAGEGGVADQPGLAAGFAVVALDRQQLDQEPLIRDLALVNELVEAADDKTLSRTIARYGRVDLLCLDELGYLELDRRGAELLFQVFTEREERASIAIASNAAISEWTRTFTDPRLCAAIVDRLTYDAHIISTGSDSYRLRTAMARHQPKT